MAKTYIKLWDSYESYFEPFGAAEVGRLVLAMMQYKSSGVEPEFSGSEKFIWPAIKRDLDEDMAYTERQAEQERASKSKRRQVTASDSKSEQVQASKSKSIKNKEKDEGSRTKDEGNKSTAPAVPTPAELCGNFGERLAETVQDWLAYKQERKESYNPTGLKSLLTQIENQIVIHGEQAVMEVIRLSMSNGWRGICWEKIPPRAAGASDQMTEFDREWVERVKKHKNG